VTSEAAGIGCGNNCAETFSQGTVVILEATPAPGSTFAGWSGPCTGKGACSVTLDAAKSVVANFTLNTYTLTVNKGGDGTVNSGPAGIDCGQDCAQTYNHGVLVYLVAMPNLGWLFAGWEGACSGEETCTVTMDEVKSITANFTPSTYALDVSKTGTGSGTVASDGGEIDCGDACRAVRPYGDELALTATADGGSVFTGWSGACRGMGECYVTMTKARSVAATFAVDETENAVFLPAIQR
jgi:hypothetical protein